MQHRTQIVDDLEKELLIWKKRCEYEGKTISKKFVQARSMWSFHKHSIVDIEASNDIMYCQSNKWPT